MPIRRAAAALALFLLLLAVYWKLAFFGAAYVWFDHYDMCQLEIPRLDFLARTLHQGHLPLWDPHVWAGLPAVGAGQPGLLYPLNLLFASLPLSGGMIPVITLNWLFIAMHFLGALFFYWLCRDQRLAIAPSIFGALSFSCAGYCGSAPWLDIGNGLSLAPLVLLFTIRLWTGRRMAQSAALLALALGACWLTGHHEIPLILSYVVLCGSAAAAVVRLVRNRQIDYRLIAWTAAALTLGAAISAIQTLPLYEFGRQAVRWVGAPGPIRWDQPVPSSVFAAYSLRPAGIAGFLLPSATAESHTTVFMGVTVIALAALGFVYRRREAAFRIAAWTGAAGLVYALDHRLYGLLPMLDKARNPVRGVFLVSLALSLMAAYGADWLLTTDRQKMRAVFAIVMVVAAAFVAVSWSGIVTEMYPALPSHYLLFGLIASAALGVLALTPAHRIKAAVPIALLLLEVTAVTRVRITRFDKAHTVCATALVGYDGLASRLRAEPNLGRISYDRDQLMTSLGDLYGFDQLMSFTAGAPANIVAADLFSPQAQSLFGVTHTIVKKDGGFEIQPAPSPHPRAWHTCTNPDPVTVSRPDNNTVLLQASLNCAGQVILSDTNYPGWEATLDGTLVPIHEANGAMRAIDAPAGTHHIEMHYRPASFRWGALITLAGLVSCLALLLAQRGPHLDR